MNPDRSHADTVTDDQHIAGFPGPHTIDAAGTFADVIYAVVLYHHTPGASNLYPRGKMARHGLGAADVIVKNPRIGTLEVDAGGIDGCTTRVHHVVARSGVCRQ